MTNIFEQTKSLVTARQVAEYYGLKVKKNGMACCPFHDDKHPSMKIDQKYYCFTCGARGDAINYVSDMFGLSPLDAVKKINNDFSLGIRISESYKKVKSNFHKRDKKEWTKEEKIQFIRRKIAEWKKVSVRVLLRYQDWILFWKIFYKPKQQEEDLHPLFVEALQKQSRIQDLIETLRFGKEEDVIDFS